MANRGDGKMFEVTVRNDMGDKIAQRIRVEGNATIQEVVEEARHQRRVAWLMENWRRVYGSRSIKDWWMLKNPMKVIKQEPIKFDVLVDQHSV
jgi:TnpA family transposase